MKQFPTQLAAGLALMAIGSPASAESASGSMAVSATIVETCRTDLGDLSFGRVDTRQLRVEAQSLVSLTCTPGAAYSVAIDNGRNGSRNMVDPTGTAFLAYEIYQDAAASRRWGAGSAAVNGIAPADGRVTLNAYGRLVATRVAASQYSDVVTVTVTF